jgi:Glycosyl hydrolases family 16
MRVLGVVASVLLASVSFAQRPAQGPVSTVPFVPEKAGYALVWQDEFEGSKLDPTKWRVRGVGPRALAYVSEEAVEVKDGYLWLWAKKKGEQLLGSAAGTEGLFSARYGYYECRAQVQKSPGVWAAFWIQSTEIAKGEDPAMFRDAELPQGTRDGLSYFRAGVDLREVCFLCGRPEVLRSDPGHLQDQGVFDSAHGVPQQPRRHDPHPLPRCRCRGLCPGLAEEARSVIGGMSAIKDESTPQVT